MRVSSAYAVNNSVIQEPVYQLFEIVLFSERLLGHHKDVVTFSQAEFSEDVDALQKGVLSKRGFLLSQISWTARVAVLVASSTFLALSARCSAVLSIDGQIQT